MFYLYKYIASVFLCTIVLIMPTASAQDSSSSAETRLTVRVEVDANRVIGEKEPFWASIVFHPTEYLSTVWGQEKMKLFREAGAALRYVRLYNQPEDAIHIGDDGSITYDWSHFDERVDLILGLGLKPMVAHFSMPTGIARYPASGKRRPFGKWVNYSPPKDYESWYDISVDFARHLVERYGEDEVATWPITIWNEPNLKHFWHDADLEEYFKLYDYAAEAIKSISPRIQVGGPAYGSNATWERPEEWRLFLEHVANGTNHVTGERGSPIDFFDIHTYGGHGAAGSSVSPFPSIDYMLQQQLWLVRMRDEYPSLQDVPFIVGEWGVSASGTRGISREPIAEVRNTHYSAAFLTALVERHLRLRRTDNPGITDLLFCVSGYENERSRDFNGYRTFDTLHGIQKPLFNAYRLLAKLGSSYVAVETNHTDGPISVIGARDGDERVTVLLTHFRHDKPFNDGAPAYVQVRTLVPWENGEEVLVNHWRIDEQHSNAYPHFVGMGSPKNLTAEQVASIKAHMGLELLDKPEHLQVYGSFETQFEAPTNSVSLIEISRR